MSKFSVNERAYVPATLLGLDRPHALVERTVLATDNRSITVDRDGGNTVRVASARAHRVPLGLLLLKIGDLSSESGVLDPLAASIAEFFRLLLPDDHLHRLELRTLTELESFWRQHHAAFSHIVITGHGSGNGYPFVDLEPPGVAGKELGHRLELASGQPVRPRQFLSLSCETGRQKVGGGFSKTSICGDFVGPYKPVHAAAASHFCQSYFASLLLEGRTQKAAFTVARSAIRGDAHFRLWRDGGLFAGQ